MEDEGEEGEDDGFVTVSEEEVSSEEGDEKQDEEMKEWDVVERCVSFRSGLINDSEFNNIS